MANEGDARTPPLRDTLSGLRLRELLVEVQDRVDQIVKKSESTMEEKTRQFKEFFSSAQRALDDLQSKFDERIHAVAEAVGSRAKLREQLKELRERIEEIESRMKDS